MYCFTFYAVRFGVQEKEVQKIVRSMVPSFSEELVKQLGVDTSTRGGILCDPVYFSPNVSLNFTVLTSNSLSDLRLQRIELNMNQLTKKHDFHFTLGITNRQWLI